MTRTIRLLVLAALATSVGACDSVMGPLFGVTLEIHGPRELTGQWKEPDWGETLPAGYRCEPRLQIRARGSERDQAIFSDITIRIYGEDGTDLGTLVYSGRDLDYMIGYGLWSGQHRFTDRIAVVAPELPYRWTLELRYFDSRGGYNNSASFTSRCVK